MLQKILDYQVIFWAIGAMGAIGVFSKMVAQITSKKLVKAASNMNKSNHSLMRLIRAKFEHACMVSDRVENVDAFVDKYLYEYKVLKIRLHTWRQWEVKVIWLCGILGAAGAGISFYLHGMTDGVLQYGAMGGVGVVTLFVIHTATDEKYLVETSKVYMVDYLENVCVHRYAKAYQKDRLLEAMEVQEEQEAEAVLQMEVEKPPIDEAVKLQKAAAKEPQEPVLAPAQETQAVPISEPDDQPDSGKEPSEPHIPREAVIRGILEEFLA